MPAKIEGLTLIQVVYDDERWKLLKKMREKASKIMKPLLDHGLNPIVYGSIARGDVTEKSDIDVFVSQPVSSQLIELYLIQAGFELSRRVLIQATPTYIPKAYIYLDELTSVSFPLAKMRREELEFYQLAGKIEYQELLEEKRVPGMNKKLLVIVPTDEGHLEFSAEQNIEEAAKLLRVNPETLRNRVKILKKRREYGKTGIYRELELPADRAFEEVLRELAARDPALRRRLRTIGE